MTALKTSAAKCLLGLLKGATKTCVITAGSEQAKSGVGVLVSESPVPGPVEFKGRFRGREGYTYVASLAASPFVCFKAQKHVGKSEDVDILPPMANVEELRKLDGAPPIFIVPLEHWIKLYVQRRFFCF